MKHADCSGMSFGIVNSAARYLARRRLQRQAAQEAHNTADVEAAAAALKQQLQEETAASAEAALRADDAAARDAEAQAVLLQQLQHAFEQQQSSKVRVGLPTKRGQHAHGFIEKFEGCLMLSSLNAVTAELKAPSILQTFMRSDLAGLILCRRKHKRCTSMLRCCMPA